MGLFLFTRPAGRRREKAVSIAGTAFTSYKLADRSDKAGKAGRQEGRWGSREVPEPPT